MKITGISDEVHDWHKEILAKRFNHDVLPKEIEYTISENTRKILGM